MGREWEGNGKGMGRGVGQRGGWVIADTGTYVELVYELLQDTWPNILQQTFAPHPYPSQQKGPARNEGLGSGSRPKWHSGELVK